MSCVVFDAGALIAFERGDRLVASVIARARVHRDRVLVPAGALAQVWRDGRKQARLASLLLAGVVEVVALDDGAARAAGQLCGVRGAADVVDASVVMCARRCGGAVLTSDVGDLARLDPKLRLVRV